MKTAVLLAFSFAPTLIAQSAQTIPAPVNSENFWAMTILPRAQSLASRIMATAGVTLDWIGQVHGDVDPFPRCRAIMIDFKHSTSPNGPPQRLGLCTAV